MTEQKVKNRGWVKNVAIIFLAVMLVLTFFSNTIMNASLPEAAVQYVQSGAITTQIRGNGTIEAKEVYQVKTTTSRKIQSVLVTRGQEVKVGDVLVLLAAGEGEELKTLQTQLDEAQYSYQQKLINMGGGSSEVKRAQEKLQEAIAKRDANVISAEEVELAKLRYEAAVDEHQRLSDLLEEAGGYVEGTGGDTLDGLRDAADAAKLDYESNSIRYSKELKFIDQLAADGVRHGTHYGDAQAYAEAIAGAFSAAGESTVRGYFVDFSENTLAERRNLGIDQVNIDDSTYSKLVGDLPSQNLSDIAKGYNAVNEAYNAYVKAVEAYEKAEEQARPQNAELNKKVKEAQRAVDDLKAEYDELSAKKTAYDSAKDEVVTCETTLEGLLKSLLLVCLVLHRVVDVHEHAHARARDALLVAAKLRGDAHPHALAVLAPHAIVDVVRTALRCGDAELAVDAGKVVRGDEPVRAPAVAGQIILCLVAKDAAALVGEPESYGIALFAEVGGPASGMHELAHIGRLLVEGAFGKGTLLPVNLVLCLGKLALRSTQLLHEQSFAFRRVCDVGEVEMRRNAPLRRCRFWIVAHVRPLHHQPIRPFSV